MKSKIKTGHCFVWEIGGTKTWIGVVRLANGEKPRIVGTPKSVTSNVADGPDATVRSYLAHLPEVAASAGLSVADVPLIAGTIPAPMDRRPDGSSVVVDMSNLINPAWLGTDYASLVHDIAAKSGLGFSDDLRVYWDNDGKAAGQGVLFEFSADVVANSIFVMLFFGTGVGGLTIAYGRILRGIGIGGEPGATLITFPNEPTYWNEKPRPSNRRKFEHFAARVALDRQLEHVLGKLSRHTLHPLHKVQLEPGDKCTIWQKRAGGVRKIADQSLNGVVDSNDFGLCLRLIDAQAEATGIYLAPLVHMLNPHFIVLGGGLTDPSLVSPAFNTHFQEQIRLHLDLNLSQVNFRSKSDYGYKFHVPTTGDCAPVIGVADLARSFWIDG